MKLVMPLRNKGRKETLNKGKKKGGRKEGRGKYTKILTEVAISSEPEQFVSLETKGASRPFFPQNM